MRELIEILKEMQLLEAASAAYAMATVVEVSGSTYRRTGARMLLSPKGKTIGTVSAGCLEKDIVERAAQVIGSGKSQLVKYDATSDDDLFWGTGTGCGGAVYALVDCHATIPVCFAQLAGHLDQDEPAVLATVYRHESERNNMTGQRVLFAKDQTVFDLCDNRELSAAIRTDAREVWSAGKNINKTYTLEDGRADVLIEFIPPPQSLIIFGGEYDVRTLLEQAKRLGWRTTIVEHRQAFANKERFPEANRVLLWHENSPPAELTLNAHTACVIMTHNYLVDKRFLIELLNSPVPYIGLIGPKKRGMQLLEDICKEQAQISEKQVSRLFGPVGLDLGADNPDEIALSIIAEIQAVMRGRTGGFLRDRKSSIH